MPLQVPKTADHRFAVQYAAGPIGDRRSEANGRFPLPRPGFGSIWVLAGAMEPSAVRSAGWLSYEPVFPAWVCNRPAVHPAMSVRGRGMPETDRKSARTSRQRFIRAISLDFQPIAIPDIGRGVFQRLRIA
jgi:hypothetical protein